MDKAQLEGSQKEKTRHDLREFADIDKACERHAHDRPGQGRRGELADRLALNVRHVVIPRKVQVNAGSRGRSEQKTNVLHCVGD